MKGLSRTSNSLVNQIDDLDKLTATIRDYFEARMGEREIDIERFDLERSEDMYDPNLVAVACALTGAESHEELFYTDLHEKRDSDTRALANIIKAMAIAFEQAQREAL